jgi:hypothetical protein
MSVVVTGIDDWVWTAYGVFDAYFRSKRSVEEYHQMRTSTSRLDPIAAGKMDLNRPMWLPREYFFKVFEIRIIEVPTEWNTILDRLNRRLSSMYTL